MCWQLACRVFVTEGALCAADGSECMAGLAMHSGGLRRSNRDPKGTPQRQHCREMEKAMARLEDLRAGAFIGRLAPVGTAKVTCENAAGAVGNRFGYRNEEAALDVVEAGLPWSFDGDSALLRLVSEAWRIGFAHLFDPYLAINAARENLPLIGRVSGITATASTGPVPPRFP